ncbi:UdgX family uracil-DNA binding protein [Pseudolysinimonas sp.]|uniref:UdgX family uracil-DNA binding protein n=1 Tax=Pseudolysinimonas sp. TaxID=2680009 RepID=UPI003F7EBC25
MSEERPGADSWIPEDPDLPALRAAAPACRGCELWEPATQVVFSVGADSARLMLVGEQPGDQEDRAGRPFVGPAGQLLARAVDEAGIARGDVYVTNAVKHFRFTRRGARRIHEKPGIAHIDACRPWLRAELAVVRPRLVVCLGATAARAVLGREARIGAERGQVLDETDPPALITAHPSSLLRTRDPADREAGFAALVADLRTAHGAAGS